MSDESTSKQPSGTGSSILHRNGMNPGAMAATLSNLDVSQSFGLTDKWTEVKCQDGTKARILKNPDDAFEIYAKDWNTKFSVIIDLLNQAKAEGNSEVNSKIVKLFDNLSYVESTLREMYKNSYLTFAATPCNEKSQEEKRAIDRIIVAASLSLIGLKTMAEKTNATNLDNINYEILKIIDKITNMIIR